MDLFTILVKLSGILWNLANKRIVRESMCRSSDRLIRLPLTASNGCLQQVKPGVAQPNVRSLSPSHHRSWEFYYLKHNSAKDPPAAAAVQEAASRLCGSEGCLW